tara:strand:- start:29784 stop:29924 length:141 start_codon:yes stop_codon:yes gene_type:complete
MPMSIDFIKVEILPQISSPLERGAKSNFMFLRRISRSIELSFIFRI